jgi:phospholipase/carboxylesterase
MPRSTMSWQIPPAEGFYTAELPNLHAQTVRTFLPTGYEPNYPYPLVVLFHGHGGSDEQVLRLAPRISRRNYICISLRGPMPLGPGEDGTPSYSWGADGETDAFAEEYMIRAVEQTRRCYHVHSERIYLAGVGEGAALAYRLALNMPEKLAGVISLNGAMPRPANGGPLFRFPEVRQLRVFIGHGVNDQVFPIDAARRDFRVLYGAGADVQFFTYPTGHQMHPHMFRDINRWIMKKVDAELAEFEDPNDDFEDETV